MQSQCSKYLITFQIKFVSREETKSTTNLGVLFFISQISALVLFTTDNLIISHFIGPAEVTSYSMVNKLYTAGTAVFAMLVTPYWSRTSVAKSHDDYNLIKKGIREMQCLWGVGIVGVLVLMIVFKPLAKVWLQKELYYCWNPSGNYPTGGGHQQDSEVLRCDFSAYRSKL